MLLCDVVGPGLESERQNLAPSHHTPAHYLRTSDRLLLRQCRRRVFPTGTSAASESAPRAASSDCCRTCKASRSARLGDDLAASNPNVTAMMRLMPSRMSVVSIAAKRRDSASHAATSPSTSTASTNSKAIGAERGAASLAGCHAAVAQNFRLSGDLEQINATHDGRPNARRQSRPGKPAEH